MACTVEMLQARDAVVDRLSRRVEALEKFIDRESRRMTDLASAMRNPKRTLNGMADASKVADAFERAAIRCEEALSN